MVAISVSVVDGTVFVERALSVCMASTFVSGEGSSGDGHATSCDVIAVIAGVTVAAGLGVVASVASAEANATSVSWVAVAAVVFVLAVGVDATEKDARRVVGAASACLVNAGSAVVTSTVFLASCV